MKPRSRKLKLWNGRWRVGQHIFVAAYSVDDVLSLLNDELGYRVSRWEIRVYWSPNCWGTPMDGITPERGAWIQTGRQPPVRLTKRQTV